MDALTLLHPRLVHFPIALMVTAWIFDLISLVFKKESVHKAAVYVYATAALVSVLSVISGLWEANRLHLHHPIVTAHRNFGLLLFIQSWVGFILYLCLRRSYPAAAKIVFSLMSAMSVILVLMVGFYGGKMVYEYGIGVAVN